MSQQRANQLVEAGVWLRLSGDHAGARRLFEQALKLDPSNARASQLLASDPLSQPQSGSSVWTKEEPPAPPVVPIPLTQPVSPPSVTPATPPSHGAQFDPHAGPVQPPGYSIEGDWSMALAPPPEVEKPLPPPRPLAPGAKSAWDSKSNPGFDVSTVYPNGVDAMDLVQKDALPERPEPAPPLTAPSYAASEKLADDSDDEVETLLNGAKDLIDLDDHSGAMDLIVKAQELAPNDQRVKKMREKSEATLQAMFESKIGRMDATPKVVLKDDEIIWLNLDHRAGFVLAQIDGTVTFDDVFAVSGMSRLDTARILAQLVEEGVIQAS